MMAISSPILAESPLFKGAYQVGIVIFILSIHALFQLNKAFPVPFTFWVYGVYYPVLQVEKAKMCDKVIAKNILVELVIVGTSITVQNGGTKVFSGPSHFHQHVTHLF